MTTKQFGFTPAGFTPAYFNTTRLDDGRYRITVRSDGDGDRTGPVAEITVSADEYAAILHGMSNLRGTPNGQ